MRAERTVRRVVVTESMDAEPEQRGSPSVSDFGRISRKPLPRPQPAPPAPPMQLPPPLPLPKPRFPDPVLLCVRHTDVLQGEQGQSGEVLSAWLQGLFLLALQVMVNCSSNRACSPSRRKWWAAITTRSGCRDCHLYLRESGMRSVRMGRGSTWPALASRHCPHPSTGLCALPAASQSHCLCRRYCQQCRPAFLNKRK